MRPPDATISILAEEFRRRLTSDDARTILVSLCKSNYCTASSVVFEVSGGVDVIRSFYIGYLLLNGWYGRIRPQLSSYFRRSFSDKSFNVSTEEVCIIEAIARQWAYIFYSYDIYRVRHLRNLIAELVALYPGIYSYYLQSKFFLHFSLSLDSGSLAAQKLRRQLGADFHTYLIGANARQYGFQICDTDILCSTGLDLSQVAVFTTANTSANKYLSYRVQDYAESCGIPVYRSPSCLWQHFLSSSSLCIDDYTIQCLPHSRIGVCLQRKAYSYLEASYVLMPSVNTLLHSHPTTYKNILDEVPNVSSYSAIVCLGCRTSSYKGDNHPVLTLRNTTALEINALQRCIKDFPSILFLVFNSCDELLNGFPNSLDVSTRSSDTDFALVDRADAAICSSTGLNRLFISRQIPTLLLGPRYLHPYHYVNHPSSLISFADNHSLNAQSEWNLPRDPRLIEPFVDPYSFDQLLATMSLFLQYLL
jgi:hypothetical protein